jgi:hypothetical protein
MQLSLRQASREAGISKSTLARAVASGRVSATRTEDGRLLFDPAEVHRVFPLTPATERATESEPGAPGPCPSQGCRATEAEGQIATPPAPVEERLPEVGRLPAVLELQARVRHLEERLAEIQRDRDEWRETAKAAINRPLMLAAPETAAPPAPRSWWWWRRTA